MISGRCKSGLSSSVAAVAAYLMFGVVAAVPASAAEDGTTWNSLLSYFEIRTDNRDAIDYRPRAPLVVPPKFDLPPPQAPNTARPSDWPADADAVARRKALLDSHRPAPLRQNSTRVTSGPVVTVVEPASDCALCLSTPWQYVKEKVGLAKKDEDKIILSGEEPPRNYLSDPPPGYRVPSVSNPAH